MYVPTDGISLPATVFIGVPSYGDHKAETSAALRHARRPGSNTKEIPCYKSSSALTFNFNLLLASAINQRKTAGVTHFAMLHADVAPDPGFIDTLLDELQAHNAGVVSCVIPIKDQLGRTTTAIGNPGKPETVKRLTIREARRLPRTFTAADAGYPDNPLLINTGCWICDLHQPWVDKFPGFDIVNGLHRDENGFVTARFFSEDWWFGVWLHAHGVKVMATTAVGLDHLDGNTKYSNRFDWGLETDPGDGEKEIAEAIQQAHEPARRLPLNRDPVSGITEDVEETVRTLAREIVVVRYAESLSWVHGWLDELLVKHGPDLTYRIYDKGPGGDTPNVGHLDWTYLHHIVTRWDELADWTVFTQADPFPHLRNDIGRQFEDLLIPGDGAAFPFLVLCREWGDDGRLHWDKFPDYWKRQYETGVIHPARLSLREWFQEYLGVDIEKLGALEYHVGAIFAVDRATIQRRPKAFYERLMASLGEGGHRCPEVAHYMERAWPYVFAMDESSQAMPDRKGELGWLSQMRRVWPDDDSPENLTPGLIQLCEEWLRPEFTIAEIGCFAGVSTAIFACFAKKVIAVDPFQPYPEIDEEILLVGEKEFQRILRRFPNISHIRKPSVEAAQEIADHSLDAVYIDGCHQYEAFIQDIRAWLPKIKPGGLLMGHDWPQVSLSYAGGFQLPFPKKVYPESSWVVQL